MPDPTSARVRVATEQDAAGIAAVHIASWQAAYRGQLPDGFLDGLSAPESVSARTRSWATGLVGGLAVLVTHDAGVVTGFAVHGSSRDEGAAATAGELYALYLHPGAWGRGLGHRLHQHALAAMAAAGRTEATLWVLETNARARAFYARQGWTHDRAQGGSRTESLAGADVLEVRYRRRLV